MNRTRSMHRRAGTRLGPRLVALAATVLAAGDAPAQTPAPSIATSGYEITRPPLVVTRAPHGWVGQKTTDREKKIGNTPETDGNSYEFVMTYGGFTKKCPSADGVVPGNFEYSLVADEVVTGEGETQRTHYVKRVVTKRLEGHVGNDAKLEFVDIEAEYTSQRPGMPTERRTVRERFKPGQQGELDMEALTRAVRVTGDLAIAAVMAGAGQNFMLALLEWHKPNQCVEFTFDPPTGGRALKPNESVGVRTTLRTKDDDKALVAGANLQVGVIEAIGSVTPRRIETQPAAPVTITYTAATQPRKGNGIDVFTLSRAGVAEGYWRIGDGRKQAGWSGQIQFTLDTRQAERHTVVQEASGHSTYKTTLTFTDGVGTASQSAEVKSSRVNRGAVDPGGGRFGENVEHPERESLRIDGSLGGTTPARVEVRLDAVSGAYEVVPEFAWVIGKQRHVSCIEGTCTTKDYYFSTNPNRDTRIEGKSSDPNRLQGSRTQRILDDLGRSHEGVNIWTVTWNLSRSN